MTVNTSTSNQIKAEIFLAYTTSWPLSSTSRCEVKLHRIWSTTVSCQRSHCPANIHSPWWQEFLCCGSENLEQPPPLLHCDSLTLNLDTYINNFKRHFSIARPRRISDFLFLRRRVQVDLLTHLPFNSTLLTTADAQTVCKNWMSSFIMSQSKKGTILLPIIFFNHWAIFKIISSVPLMASA